MAKKEMNEKVTEVVVDAEVTEVTQTEEVTEKESLGTKLGRGVSKVKNSKAAKVVGGVLLTATAVGAVLLIGKHSNKSKDEDCDLGDTSFEDIHTEEF